MQISVYIGENRLKTEITTAATTKRKAKKQQISRQREKKNRWSHIGDLDKFHSVLLHLVFDHFHSILKYIHRNSDRRVHSAFFLRKKKLRDISSYVFFFIVFGLQRWFVDYFCYWRFEIAVCYSLLLLLLLLLTYSSWVYEMCVRYVCMASVRACVSVCVFAYINICTCSCCMLAKRPRTMTYTHKHRQRAS